MRGGLRSRRQARRVGVEGCMACLCYTYSALSIGSLRMERCVSGPTIRASDQSFLACFHGSHLVLNKHARLSAFPLDTNWSSVMPILIMPTLFFI